MYPKRDTSRRLSDIVLDVLREGNLTSRMLETRAASLWQVVLGPTVNRSTREVYVRDGVMHVMLSSSVVRHELSMMKMQILQRINQAVGSEVVKDIVFR